MARQPTIKQIKAIQFFVENHGTSVSAAMRAAGYTDVTAKNPSNLTQSDVWKEFLESQGLDRTLTEVAQDGLKANRVISARVNHKDADERTDDFIEVPDHDARHKFWKSINEMKNRFPKSGPLGLPPGTKGAVLMTWETPAE